MGHFVQAFVGSRTALERIQRQYAASRVIDLPQAFALLPLLDTLYDAIPEGEQPDLAHAHFQFLTPKIINLLVRCSENDSIGYFETDYFGGEGNQGAVLTRNGTILFGPKVGSGTVNAMLRLIGVNINGAHDEFDAIGLSHFRSNDDWIG